MNKAEICARIDQAVQEAASEIEEFGCQLIRIKTENPPGENYRQCAELIGKKLKEFGYQVEYVTVPEGRLQELAPHGHGLERVSVIGRYPGKQPHPVLHFSGHMDVVPAGEGWSVDPYTGIVKDGRLYGRGASDQKSGIIASTFVSEVVKNAGFKLLGTLEQSATPDEETGGMAGVGYLVEQGYIKKGKTDYCVITECLDVDQICIGHRGTLWLTVETEGKKCHGSMPEVGINALDKMVEFIHVLNTELKPEVAKRTTTLPVTPPACRKNTLVATVIHAGTKVNTVPDKCVAELDRRIIPPETAASALAEIEAVCARLQAKDPDFRYKLEPTLEVDPTLVSDDTAVVKAFMAGGEQVLGRFPKFVLSPGMDDQRYVVKQGGIEQCIVYGPGPLALAHQNDEYVEMADILTAVKIMALAAMELLGYEEI